MKRACVWLVLGSLVIGWLDALPVWAAGEITLPAIQFTAQGGGEVKKAEASAAAKADAEYVHFWFTPGHWLEWTVDGATAGEYELTVRYAAKNEVKRGLTVNVPAVKAVNIVTLPKTGRWNAWQDSKAATVLLQTGRNVIRMTCADDLSMRLSELRLAAPGRAPIRVPAATFSAEGGGQVQVVTPPTQGTVTDWKRADHWLEWTVDGATAGRYGVELHYMSDGYNQLALQLDGVPAKGLEAFVLPYTGDDNLWTRGTLPVAVTLHEGKNTLRLATLGGEEKVVPTIGGPFGLSAIRLTPLPAGAAPQGNVLRLLTAAELKRPKIDAPPVAPAPLGPPLAAVADALPLQEGQVWNVGGKKITVGKIDVLPYIENRFSKRFEFENFATPAVAQFRAKYQLDAVVASGQDEFTQQVLLMKWVWDRWDFGHARERYNLLDPFEILDQAQREHKFQCMHSTSVLTTAANSLGWVCRQMAIPQHSFCEIWSNQYRRWVLLDATSNFYPEKNGQPLNTYELRQALLRDGGGVLRAWMGTTGLETKPQSASYGQSLLFIGYITNTDTLERPPQYANDKFFITKDELTAASGKKWHTRDNPENPAVDPYFPVNQAAVALAPADNGLKVTLGTLTPNFKEFQVRVDGGEWRASDTVFAWKLHAGEIRLQARSLNQFGVAGPVSTVNLNVAE